jgi:hypothetical protein
MKYKLLHLNWLAAKEFSSTHMMHVTLGISKHVVYASVKAMLRAKLYDEVAELSSTDKINNVLADMFSQTQNLVTPWALLIAHHPDWRLLSGRKQRSTSVGDVVKSEDGTTIVFLMTGWGEVLDTSD